MGKTQDFELDESVADATDAQVDPIDSNTDSNTDNGSSVTEVAPTDAPTEGVETVEAASPEKTPEELEAEKALAEATAKAVAEAAAKEQELKASVAAFEQAIADVMVHEDRDASNGTLPNALVETVTLAASKVTGAKNRRALLDYLLHKMQEEMKAGPTDHTAFTRAATYMHLRTAVEGAAPPKPEIFKTPVDPTQAFVGQIAAMILAPNLVPVPEEVKPDWTEKARQLAASLNEDTVKYRTWLTTEASKPEGERAEAPKVNDVVLAAARLAVGRRSPAGRKPGGTNAPKAPKAPRSTSDERGDIAAHVLNAFEGKSVGTVLTIGEIVKTPSADYPAGRPPSSGAISARLFPKSGVCTIAGIEGRTKDDGPQFEKISAIKVA